MREDEDDRENRLSVSAVAVTPSLGMEFKFMFLDIGTHPADSWSEDKKQSKTKKHHPKIGSCV